MSDVRWQLFSAIWNSHGQLKWLKAYLVRNEAVAEGKSIAIDSAMPADTRDEDHRDGDLRWLAGFIEYHRQEGLAYPNPYFGGTNPLHLRLWL